MVSLLPNGPSTGAHLSGKSSSEARLRFGVLHGSVHAGTTCFHTVYTAPLGDVARMHGLELHLYADDTQVYIAFCPVSKSDTDSAVRKINACVADIRTWMMQNRLQLNDSKTETLLVCVPHMRSKLGLAPRGGRLSHCAVGCCQKHWGIFRSESEHATSRQAALQESQLPSLEHRQDTSPAQRQDS